MKKILVVTPVFNAGTLLPDTLDSVLNQRDADDVRITYYVCDGGSTDETQSVLADYASRFRAKNIDFHFVSEKDGGMYDALAKGFRLAGVDYDVFCYINAGDYFSPYAFGVVVSSMSTGMDWITGANCTYDQQGRLIKMHLPVAYPAELILQGFYGTVLPYIQQESTFWSRRLHQQLSLEKLAGFKYAGDHYLWTTFARHASLKIVRCWLSGFRRHEGQLSERFIDQYKAEFHALSEPKRWRSWPLAMLIALCWLLPREFRPVFKNDVIFP